MFRLRRKPPVTDLERRVAHAAEVGSLGLALSKKQVEEEVERDLTGVTEGVARAVPKMEEAKNALQALGKGNQVMKDTVGDCALFASELGDVSDRLMDELNGLAEEIEQRLSR